MVLLLSFGCEAFWQKVSIADYISESWICWRSLFYDYFIPCFPFACAQALQRDIACCLPFSSPALSVGFIPCSPPACSPPFAYAKSQAKGDINLYRNFHPQLFRWLAHAPSPTPKALQRGINPYLATINLPNVLRSPFASTMAAR